MNPSILEPEGTWDEIQNRMPDFNGKKLRVTVRVTEDETRERASSVDAALASIWQSTPESAWASLPPDFVDNLDHHLYGTPKRQ